MNTIQKAFEGMYVFEGKNFIFQTDKIVYK